MGIPYTRYAGGVRGAMYLGQGVLPTLGRENSPGLEGIETGKLPSESLGDYVKSSDKSGMSNWSTLKIGR